MTQELLEHITVEPTQSAQGSVIWLHGLGADGHDFEPIVPQLRLPESLALRFVFPHAPLRSVTINNGLEMRAWYDILGFDLGSREDETAIPASARQVTALIEQEMARGIPAEKILLAGFSQGGALALYTGLRSAKPLAGILALSCYMPLAGTVEAEHQMSNQSMPVMIAHGLYDPICRLDWAERSREQLQQLGFAVDWHTYPMEHGLCAQEITDMSQWIQRCFS